MSENRQKPPDWAVVFMTSEVQKDRLDDMADILTAIMYALAEADNGTKQEKGSDG